MFKNLQTVDIKEFKKIIREPKVRVFYWIDPDKPYCGFIELTKKSFTPTRCSVEFEKYQGDYYITKFNSF